jgi:hypothetical protein
MTRQRRNYSVWGQAVTAVELGLSTYPGTLTETQIHALFETVYIYFMVAIDEGKRIDAASDYAQNLVTQALAVTGVILT